MKDNVIDLSKRTGLATMQSPKQALEQALEYIGEKGSFEKGNKLLILGLDDTNENFSVSFVQAGMKMSECVALCEVAKTIFKEEMGY